MYAEEVWVGMKMHIVAGVMLLELTSVQSQYVAKSVGVQ